MAVIKYLMFFFNFLFWVSCIITTCMVLDSLRQSLLVTNPIIEFLAIYHMFIVSAKEVEHFLMSESFYFSKSALTNCRLKLGFMKK